MESLVGSGTRRAGYVAMKILINNRSTIADITRMGEYMHSEAKVVGRYNARRVSLYASKLCDEERGLVLVAKHEDKVIGFLMAHAGENYLSGELWAEEVCIYVDTAHRRSGAAVVMLSSFEDWAVSFIKAARIRVTVQNNDEYPAIARWYRSKGYIEGETSLTKEVIY